MKRPRVYLWKQVSEVSVVSISVVVKWLRGGLSEIRRSCNFSYGWVWRITCRKLRQLVDAYMTEFLRDWVQLGEVICVHLVFLKGKAMRKQSQNSHAHVVPSCINHTGIDLCFQNKHFSRTDCSSFLEKVTFS